MNCMITLVHVNAKFYVTEPILLHTATYHLRYQRCHLRYVSKARAQEKPVVSKDDNMRGKRIFFKFLSGVIRLLAYRACRG